MHVIPTDIPDLVVVEPKVFEDERGHFFEAHSAEKFAVLGIEPGVMQINQSSSTKGVLRGLHYQRPPHDQTKLVRCIRGTLFDVAVDIRKGSPTFGKWFGVELSAENKRMLYVPSGFAHGFYAVTDCEMLYLCGKSGYDKASEGGLRYDDPAVGIVWPFDVAQGIADVAQGIADSAQDIADGEPNVNERDRTFPDLATLADEPAFIYGGTDV